MSQNSMVRSMTASNMQKAAAAVGAVFLLVGILGFIPGITSDYDMLEFAGPESEAMLLGIFQVSTLHNIVHLVFGVAGLATARTWSAARSYLVVGGAVYLLVFVYGILVDKEDSANFIPVNGADDWLHFLLAIGMIALGLLLGRERSAGRG